MKTTSLKHLLYLLLLLRSLPITAQLDNQRLLENANEIVEAEGVLEILNEEEAVFSLRKKIIVLNKASEANTFSVYYNPENKILDLEADIYDLGGQPIRKVRKSEIRDVAAVDGFSLYSESRVRYLELNHSEYPYVLEFSYRQRLRGLSFAAGRNWYFQDRSSSAVTRSSYTISVPDEVGINHRIYNLELEPEISRKGEQTVYTWVATNLPAIEFEPYDIPIHRQIPMLRVSPGKFQIDDFEGNMESWKAYGDFLHQLWTGRDELPDELRTKVHTLTEGLTTDTEKITALYRHLQESKRYVSVQLGIGGWQPYAVDYVEEHGYGDCKALSNYMKGMLQEIGIASYPVIVYAGGRAPYEVENDFVDPEFNHAILYVPQEDMWLECTSTINPPGYLGRFTNDRKVLLVTPEGGQLARTPKLSAAENRTVEELTVELADDGAAALTYEARLYGIPHEEWRRAAFAFSQVEMENEIRQLGKLPSMSLGEITVENTPDLPESRIAFTAATSRYATRAGKRLFVPLNVICPRTYVPDEVTDRTYPVLPPYGYTEEATVGFEVPEGYRTESLPKSQNLETPFGKYTISIAEEEGRVTYHRYCEMYEEEHPAEAYEAFRSFLSEIAKRDGSKMVLVRQ